jgi:indole-3-glycerol phosphate synthase
MSFLNDIVESTRASVEASMRKRPLADLKRMIRDNDPVRDFSGAIRKGAEEKVRLIAEIKQASPSKGRLRTPFEPTEIAMIYRSEGASALSVLTENLFFKGALEDIGRVRKSADLPVLRKDFLLREYQVYESRSFQADAVLLIVSLLDDFQLKGFFDIASGLGMGCLVEVHTEPELERCLGLGLHNIGINNRDLASFETDLDVTMRLIKKIPPDRTVVAESGISTRDEIKRLDGVGVHAVLIGETFMKSPDIGAKIRELFG